MKTLNGYLVIEEIVEEKTANGLHIPGVSAEQIRAKKGKVITSGDIEAVQDDDVIFYDGARSFTLVDTQWEKPVTIIRISEVIVII